MKFTPRLIFLCICISANLITLASGSCNPADQSFGIHVLDTYKNAYNKADSEAIRSWSIDQQSYNTILSDLQKKKYECLSQFDLTYSTNTVMEEFQNTCKLSPVFTLDSLYETTVSNLSGCGGILYKKVDAKARFSSAKEKLELPISLIFIKLGEENYKLMMQIVNYKILQHEQ